MKNFLILCFAACLVLSSCTTTTIAATNKNLTFEKYLQSYVVISHVSIKISSYEYNKGEPLEKYFEKELKRYGGDAIINLKIQIIPNLLKNDLIITGDIIAYKGAQ